MKERKRKKNEKVEIDAHSIQRRLNARRMSEKFLHNSSSTMNVGITNKEECGNKK